MRPTTENIPFWITENLPAPGASLRLDAYLALPETRIHMEWHHGTVIYPDWDAASMRRPAPSSRHQMRVVRLIVLVSGMIPDGKMLTAPMDVRMGGRIVQPDVFWVAEESACVDHGTHYTGPPDLAIEVLPPSNTRHDRIEKFRLYEAEGVREYWLVSAEEDYIEVYNRADQNGFERVGAYTAGEVFASPLLAQTMSAAAIFSG